MDQIRVLIVDDQPVVRQGVKAVFEPLPDIVLAGEAGNGFEALRAVRRWEPHVVLMDVNMPGMDGLEATKRICSNDGGRPPKVVILTMYDQDEHVFDALRAGASGFLLKDASPAKVAEAVREVARGEALLASSVTRRLIREFVRGPAAASRATGELRTLTARERDVFRLLVRGLNNQDIARTLVLGESTVKSHVKHLYQKLGVRDRVQVVIYAHEHGLV